jgi:surface antigen
VLSAVIEGTPPVGAAPVGPALTVLAPIGTTVAFLAAQYGRNAAAITWANGYGPNTEPQAGSPVLLPPGPGALVKVVGGELPNQFAQKLGLDLSVLLDYNVLQTGVPLAAGTYLQVPLASAPHGALNSAAFIPETAGIPEVAPSHGADSFPYGECTYYVATRRAVNWDGNADMWWPNARPYRPEGNVPVAGAIVVFDYAPIGHVAFVDSVNPDGSFVISEMNYDGWGEVDQRTISATDPNIVGFIY